MAENDKYLQQKRVVITGMGVVSPVGNSVPEMWSALTSGRSGIGPITSIDPSAYSCRIGGEVKDFNPRDHIPRKILRQMPLSSQLAVVAADQALHDSCLNLDEVDRDRVGVIIGTAGGNSVQETEAATLKIANSNVKRITPVFSIKVWPNMAAYFIAERHHFRGYNMTVCTACASGTQAIGEAAMIVRRGGADVVVTGATEFFISHTLFLSFIASQGLSTQFNDQPERAMRPFDADRDGFIPGAGSAIMVLEPLERAQARGARIYAEILGAGVSNDAFNLIAPDPNGAGAALAMTNAMADASVEPSDVGYINAHGTSTPLGDAKETMAIKAAFGDYAYKIPISSTKSMVGHMMGASGALEAVASVMTLQDQIIHPTINYETPDPLCDLDYVPNKARRARVEVAMSNSFGLGGQNASLVLGRM
jgi:3-oxoacyl-[acyl-carrier-protein] synthase II